MSCKDEGPDNPLEMWDYVLEEEPPQGLSVRDIRKLHSDPVKVTEPLEAAWHATLKTSSKTTTRRTQLERKFADPADSKALES